MRPCSHPLLLPLWQGEKIGLIVFKIASPKCPGARRQITPFESFPERRFAIMFEQPRERFNISILQNSTDYIITIALGIKFLRLNIPKVAIEITG